MLELHAVLVSLWEAVHVPEEATQRAGFAALMTGPNRLHTANVDKVNIHTCAETQFSCFKRACTKNMTLVVASTKYRMCIWLYWARLLTVYMQCGDMRRTPTVRVRFNVQPLHRAYIMHVFDHECTQ